MKPLLLNKFAKQNIPRDLQHKVKIGKSILYHGKNYLYSVIDSDDINVFS